MHSPGHTKDTKPSFSKLYLCLRKFLKLLLPRCNLIFNIDTVDLMINLRKTAKYLKIFLISAVVLLLPDVAINRQHQIVTLDILSKELQPHS